MILRVLSFFVLIQLCVSTTKAGDVHINFDSKSNILSDVVFGAEIVVPTNYNII